MAKAIAGGGVYVPQIREPTPPQSLSFDALPQDVVDQIFAFVALGCPQRRIGEHRNRLFGGYYEPRIGPLTRLNKRALPAIRRALNRYVFIQSEYRLLIWARRVMIDEEMQRRTHWLAIDGESDQSFRERARGVKSGVLSVICPLLKNLEVLDVELTHDECSSELTLSLQSLPSLKCAVIYNLYDDASTTERADRPRPLKLVTWELVRLLAESISANFTTLILDGFRFAQYDLAKDQIERREAPSRLMFLRRVRLRESTECKGSHAAPTFVVQLLDEAQRLEQLDLRIRGDAARVQLVVNGIAQHRRTLRGLSVDFCDITTSERAFDLHANIVDCPKLQVLSWSPQCLLDPLDLVDFRRLRVVRCAVLENDSLRPQLAAFLLGIAALVIKQPSIRKVLLPETITFCGDCLNPMEVRKTRASRALTSQSLCDSLKITFHCDDDDYRPFNLFLE